MVRLSLVGMAGSASGKGLGGVGYRALTWQQLYTQGLLSPHSDLATWE